VKHLKQEAILPQVKHTRLADLTVSEKQRLNVACHLLLDTDILVLDQVRAGQDRTGEDRTGQERTGKGRKG
jgi:energy-coupling factor transporter ATP-binding protein EcfA2